MARRRDGLRVAAAVGLIAVAGVALARAAGSRAATAGASSSRPRALADLVGPEGARQVEQIARGILAQQPQAAPTWRDTREPCPWPAGRPWHVGQIEYTLRCG